MKRISIVAIAAITIAIWTPSVHGFGFEPLGVDGLLRLTGVGFGQGYHSMPCNGALRQSYNKAQCQRFQVVPPQAYPCSPRAPQMNWQCAGAQSQHPMVQYAAPHMMDGGYSQDMDDDYESPENDLEDDLKDKWDYETNASENNWDSIPETNPKRSPTSRPPTRNPAEDSPKREAMPKPNDAKPNDAKSPKAEVGPLGEDMLDELDSYFGDDVGPGPSVDHQSMIRRLPPADLPTTIPPTNDVFKSTPSTDGATAPGAPPKPKDSDVWW